MKKILLLSFLFCTLGAFAQEPQKFAVSLGPEWNMNATDNFAAGLVLGFSFNLPQSLALGFTVTGSSNFNGIVVIEPSLMFRGYILGKDHTGLFVQADIGAHYASGLDEVKTVVSGGIRGGLRLPMGTFFIEPFGRFGYPFFFGIGILGGIVF